MNNKISIAAKLAFISILFGLFMSCSGIKQIGFDEKILTKNIYQITTDDPQVNIADLRSDLESIVKQIPVKKNYINVRTYNKPATIYDRNLTRESAESFEKYLKNRKGFFHVNVEYEEVEIPDRKINVIYHVVLGPRSYINHITYQSEDTLLVNLLQKFKESSALNTNMPLDADILDIEKARLMDQMKNEGYANFNANYVEFRGDSSENLVDLILHVYKPIETAHHIKYEIGHVNVYTNHEVSLQPDTSHSQTLEGIRYYSTTSSFMVDPRIIHDILTIKPGYIYSKKKELKTNQNINRLAPFRFAVVDPYLSNDTSTLYNYNIFLTPHQHKWTMDAGLNLFYSSVSANFAQNLFGFSGDLSFQNRNFLNKAIKQTIALELTSELNFPNFPGLDSIRLNTISAQLTNRYDIPKVIDIFRVSKFFNRFGIISDASLENIHANGTTTAELSAGLTYITNQYDLTTANISWSYNFQPHSNLRYRVRQIGLDVVNTEIDPIFQSTILASSPLLELSLQDYFFTGLFFRELSVVRQFKPSQSKSQFLLLASFEQSGFENFLTNKLVNGLTSYSDQWGIGGLDFTKFIRFEGDLRYYLRVKDRSSFAAKFVAAAALPYGDTRVVPHIKQFFVGGPNSVRGWQLRELGPGTYVQPPTGNAFFQAGDFKIDFSAEYRFDLFWYWEAAVFLDGGNVWLINGDDTRQGSRLTWSFIDQFALSAGWGLRLDFDYFLFRFDFGYKMRLPAADPETGNRFVLFDKTYNKNLLGTVSFAINYPF